MEREEEKKGRGKVWESKIRDHVSMCFCTAGIPGSFCRRSP